MASTYISRTPSSNGSETTGTFSAWIKRSSLGSYQKIYCSRQADNEFFLIQFQNDDKLQVNLKIGGTDYLDLRTNAVFRDVSAWLHLVVTIDSANGTQSDRARLYINGTRETSFSTNTNNMSQNINSRINGTAQTLFLGTFSGSGDYFDGSMTHLHWIDGTAYDSSTFGESDSVSGIWKPKTAPSVTYGTNGFFLKFENSGNMDLDSSGNNLTFTTSGTLTQNVDTPSNNFATLNTLQGAIASGLTLINGNLTIDGNTGTAWRSLPATLGVSTGKWYYEVKVKNLADNVRIGLVDVDQAQQLNGYFNNLSRGYAYNNSGEKSNNNSSASYGNSYTTNDIIGIAMDLDNSKLYFSKNGVFQNSGDPTSGSTGTGSAYDISSSYTYAPCVATYQPTDKLECNFGQGYFGTTAVASANADDGGLGIMEYDVPANYRVLCTKNIKDYG